MSLQLKYTIFVLAISGIGIIIGIFMLKSAYGKASKKKELKLAFGNILIAVFVAMASAFLAEFFKHEEVDIKLVTDVSDAVALKLNASSPTITSTSECLNHFYLTDNIWHYSLTHSGGKSFWQVAQPKFSRQSSNKIIGSGMWLSALDQSRTEYNIEVGCRGKRGILLFTLITQELDSIPTVEVYPELPDSQEELLIGYAIDQTWDTTEVLAPVFISHLSVHGSQEIGLITDSGVNKQISKLWREKYESNTTKMQECSLCTTLSKVQ